MTLGYTEERRDLRDQKKYNKQYSKQWEKEIKKQNNKYERNQIRKYNEFKSCFKNPNNLTNNERLILAQYDLLKYHNEEIYNNIVKKQKIENKNKEKQKREENKKQWLENWNKLRETIYNLCFICFICFNKINKNLWRKKK